MVGRVLKTRTGPLLIGFSAILWATDALFRVPTVRTIDATLIVLIEHLIVVVTLLPFLLLTERRKSLFEFTRNQWLSLILIGSGGSAIATVFFTKSFQYTNPSVVILLQKLQPIIAILLAYRFLGERPSPRFYGWSSLAFLSAAILSLPELGLDHIWKGLDLRSIGAVFSIGAAVLWAAATVAGRSVALTSDFLTVTFWRFFFGLFTLFFLFIASGSGVPWTALQEPEMMRSLLYMSYFPGMIAMLAYYAGLKRTPASIATIAELLFPVGAVALNAIFLDVSLEPLQLFASALLLIAVTMISR
jgi:DME family drug/metabolite transporter